jgi:transcriptional regulator of nitric oxide reductase
VQHNSLPVSTTAREVFIPISKMRFELKSLAFITRGTVRQAFITRGSVRQAFITRGSVRQAFITRGSVRQAFKLPTDRRNFYTKTDFHLNTALF